MNTGEYILKRLVCYKIYFDNPGLFKLSKVGQFYIRFHLGMICFVRI